MTEVLNHLIAIAPPYHFLAHYGMSIKLTEVQYDELRLKFPHLIKTQSVLGTRRDVAETIWDFPIQLYKATLLQQMRSSGEFVDDFN